MGLRVLITNNTVGARAGTEMYVHDLATALLDRGHKPVVFSTHVGEVGQALRAATVPVIDRLDALADPPDIIHGHHHVDTLIALLHFAQTPGIYVCHGWLPWEEAPPIFSRIRRYLAVDETCCDRMVCEHGIPRRDVEVLLNFVDLNRFRERPVLPVRLRKALVFSNAASESTYVAAVRKACADWNVEVDVCGLASGHATNKPEDLLRDYDLVFAKARAAIEAMAVGTAVILCDGVGVGPLVTTANFDLLRPVNFGIRALRQPLTVEFLSNQLSKYDPEDAQAVSARVRQSAGRDAVVDRLVEIYHAAIDEQQRRNPPDREREEREISRYLQWLAPRGIDLANLHARISGLLAEHSQVRYRLTEDYHQLIVDHEKLRLRSDQLEQDRDQLREQSAQISKQLVALSADHQTLINLLASTKIERDGLKQELTATLTTATWRLHGRLTRWPVIASPLRHLARLLAGPSRAT